MNSRALITGITGQDGSYIAYVLQAKASFDGPESTAVTLPGGEFWR